MRIFKATAADVPRMMECAKACCLEHGQVALGGPLDEKHYAAVWRSMLRRGEGVMFLLEDPNTGRVVGGIGGARHLKLLTGKPHCSQIFWYMQPDYRGGMAAARLFKMLEAWADQQGCKSITQPLLPSMPEKTREFFTKSGYVKTEVTYRKELSV